MISLKQEQIIKLFKTSKKWTDLELWYSGRYGEGKYELYRWGQLKKQCFYINSILQGEYKLWDVLGELTQHTIYKDGNIVKDLL